MVVILVSSVLLRRRWRQLQLLSPSFFLFFVWEKEKTMAVRATIAFFFSFFVWEEEDDGNYCCLFHRCVITKKVTTIIIAFFNGFAAKKATLTIIAFLNGFAKKKRKATTIMSLGVCTLWWPYMDVKMVVFLVFLMYKKINKIRSIEIIIKKTHLFKTIIINLSKMKKSNQNHG